MDFDTIKNVNVTRDEAKLLDVYGQLVKDPEIARTLADIAIAVVEANKEVHLELIRTSADIETEQLRMMPQLYDTIATDLGAKVPWRRWMPWLNYRVYEAIKTALELSERNVATHRVLAKDRDESLRALGTDIAPALEALTEQLASRTAPALPSFTELVGDGKKEPVFETER